MRKLLAFLLTGTVAGAFALDFGAEVSVGWTKVKGEGNAGISSLDTKTDGFFIEGAGIVRQGSLVGKVKAGHYSGDGDYTLVSYSTYDFDQKSYWVEATGGYRIQFAGFELTPYAGLGYWKIKGEIAGNGWKREKITYLKAGVSGSRELGFLKGYVDLALLRTLKGKYESDNYDTDLDKKFHYQIEAGTQWKFLKLGVFYQKWNTDLDNGTDRDYKFYGVKTGVVF